MPVQVGDFFFFSATITSQPADMKSITESILTQRTPYVPEDSI